MIAKSKKVKVGLLCSYPEKQNEYEMIPLSNIPDVSPKAEGGDIELVTDKLGAKTSYIDDQHLTITSNLETYLEGVLRDYDSANEPSKKVSKYHELLVACGLEYDYTSSDDRAIYTTTSNPTTSVLVYQLDGEFRNILGASGSFTINAEVGKPLQIQFNMQAYTDSLVPQSGEHPDMGAQAEYEDFVLINKISGFTIDGSTVNMTTLTLDMKTEIQDTYAIQQSEFSLTDYDPQVTVKAYKQKNDQSAWVAFQNQNLQEIILTGTSHSGNTVKITIPYARIMDLKESDDSGRVAIERTYRAESGSFGNIILEISNI